MAATVIVDSGYLVALFDRRDKHHNWAAGQAEQTPPPWQTCEAVLSETLHLLPRGGGDLLAALVRRKQLLPSFCFAAHAGPVLDLIAKYRQLPMSFADACLVRMTEILADPVVLTTDADFRVYRRHSRQVVPCVLPY